MDYLLSLVVTLFILGLVVIAFAFPWVALWGCVALFIASLFMAVHTILGDIRNRGGRRG